ncbi:MAG: hypothetical protein R6W70_01000 [bacterium]
MKKNGFVILTTKSRETASKTADILRSVHGLKTTCRKIVYDNENFSAQTFCKSPGTSLISRYRRESKHNLAEEVKEKYPFFYNFVSSLSDSAAVFFIWESSVESYMIRNALFLNRIPFFTVTPHFFRPDSVLISPVSSDLGSPFRDMKKQKKLIRHIKKNRESSFLPDMSVYSKLNISSHIAVDIPPQDIPGKYLGYMRNKKNIGGRVISFLSEKTEQHPPIQLICEKASEEDMILWKEIFKNRSEFCKNIESLSPDTTIITWSTHRFFQFLSRGLRPLAVSRSLAAELFSLESANKKGDIIKSVPSGEKCSIFFNFVENVISLDSGFPLNRLLKIS